LVVAFAVVDALVLFPACFARFNFALAFLFADVPAVAETRLECLTRVLTLLLGGAASAIEPGANTAVANMRTRILRDLRIIESFLRSRAVQARTVQRRLDSRGLR
jgi:hypothetical protein